MSLEKCAGFTRLEIAKYSSEKKEKLLETILVEADINSNLW